MRGLALVVALSVGLGCGDVDEHTAMGASAMPHPDAAVDVAGGGAAGAAEPGGGGMHAPPGDASAGDRDGRASQHARDGGAQADAQAPVPPMDGSGGDAAGDAGPPSGSDAGDAAVEPPAAGTYLNEADAAPEVRIEADGVSAEWLGLTLGGVRSTRAIAPFEGVFYFEARLEQDVFDAFTIGVATAAAPLDEYAGENDQSFGIDPGGRVYANGPAGRTRVGGRVFGFVLDYADSTPTVHVIASLPEGPAIVHSQSFPNIDAPLFIYLAGIRRTTETHVTINPGNDTVDAPFAFDPAALLRDAGFEAAAAALVPGWGASYAGTWNEPPVLHAPAGTSAAAGTEVTLAASASDLEDGPLDAEIVWDVPSTGYGPERVRGQGPSFTFTPRVLGIHPVRLTVTDAGGKRARAVVDVHASGELPQYEDVRLAPDPQSGSGIVVSDDGLRVRWTVDAKNAIRANQALYGAFWYFEAQRLIPPANQAPGLVIGGVSLDPLRFNVTPPSCSVQTTGGGVFQNLIFRAPMPDTGDAIEYYGFAVDYRGRYPIVHIVLGGQVTTLHLTDATVPIHPMLYGNPTGAGAAWDLAINFGGTPFHYDPVAALEAAGIDASALRLCWGTRNRACAGR